MARIGLKHNHKAKVTQRPGQTYREYKDGLNEPELTAPVQRQQGSGVRGRGKLKTG